MNRIARIVVGLLLIAPITRSLAQNPIEWAKFESKADRLVAQTGSVGASVIVVNRDSTLFYKGYGHLSLASNQGITDSTLFVLGSITKTFTAIGILKLVQDGKLKLEDEVKRIAPELPISNQWEVEFPIRVSHLLEHTSGFDELHLKDKSIPVGDDEFPLIDGIQIVKNSLQTRWKPGTGFAYSNVGYLVAGYLMEKVSGKAYNDFMVQEVLAPLRMENSSLRLSEIPQEFLAKSYAPSKKELPFKHIFTRPTGSLISSSHDMGFFLRTLLNQEEACLRRERWEEFERHHSIQAFDKTENGYRLGIYPRFRKGRMWLGHGGSINKYNSEFEYC
ncbi:MAG: serine hydrolase domain-containing protein, partial [Bacteroidota bacterium]